MDSLLQNLVVIITGASKGIGKAIAEELSRHGCSLALIARNEAALEEVKKSCKQRGAEKVICIPIDLTNQIDVDNSINLIRKSFGSIDVLINNHGIYNHHFICLEKIQLMKETLKVNLWSTIYITTKVLPHILESKHPSRAIIFNASIAAKYAEAGSAAYCASKHGILGFSHSLFEEIRESNIKVSSICAGYTNTTMEHDKLLNSNKMIQPEDIAQAVVFILSSSLTICPVEFIVRPQNSPYIIK